MCPQSSDVHGPPPPQLFSYLEKRGGYKCVHCNKLIWFVFFLVIQIIMGVILIGFFLYVCVCVCLYLQAEMETRHDIVI